MDFFLTGKKFSSLINIVCIVAAKAEALGKCVANIKYCIQMESMNVYDPAFLPQQIEISAYAWINVQDITISYFLKNYVWAAQKLRVRTLT